MCTTCMSSYIILYKCTCTTYKKFNGHVHVHACVSTYVTTIVGPYIARLSPEPMATARVTGTGLEFVLEARQHGNACFDPATCTNWKMWMCEAKCWNVRKCCTCACTCNSCILHIIMKNGHVHACVGKKKYICSCPSWNICWQSWQKLQKRVLGGHGMRRIFGGLLMRAPIAHECGLYNFPNLEKFHTVCFCVSVISSCEGLGLANVLVKKIAN